MNFEDDDLNALEAGTRVWVYDPLLFGPKSVPGKITACNVNLDSTIHLLNDRPIIEYEVNFGALGRSWISEFQITGYLKAVA